MKTERLIMWALYIISMTVLMKTMYLLGADSISGFHLFTRFTASIILAMFGRIFEALSNIEGVKTNERISNRR